MKFVQSRRSFLKSSALSISALIFFQDRVLALSNTSTDVIAGAIRWDAWYAQTGSSREAQDALGPEKWEGRAPWFASVDRPGHILTTGRQEDIDLECQFAAASGLKYWAFVMFPDSSAMSTAWHYYQNSSNRNLVNWCAIVALSEIGSANFSDTDTWRANADKYVEYFRQPYYQTVLGNRPLVYIFWNRKDVDTLLGGDENNFGRITEYVRSKCVSSNIGNPYIVIMTGIPTDSARLMKETGADAISSYVPDVSTPQAPNSWDILEAKTKSFWDSMVAQGVDCVPIAITGWDTRARREHIVAKAAGASPPTAEGYFDFPSDLQLERHLLAAIDFVKSHPKNCRSKALLIYSWDECDEGGNALIPTIGDPPNLGGNSEKNRLSRKLKMVRKAIIGDN